MQKPSNLPYYFEWSRQFPHIAAADLFGNNIANEIAVMAIDNRNGDLFFIRLDYLDPIDIKRLRQIILKRDSTRYPLWDLMAQTTLANGMNALEFFEQFVKIRTVTGQILTRGSGERGLPIDPAFGYRGPAAQQGQVDTAPTAHDVDYVPSEVDESDVAAVPSPVAKRRAGRPPKAAK